MNFTVLLSAVINQLGEVASIAGSAPNKEDITQNILICAENCEIFYPDLFKYKILYLDDAPDEDLLVWLYEAFQFINDSKNNIYIHCVMGISRSPSIVISYLMFKNKWNFKKTFNYVKNKRPEIQPNSGFIEQLLSMFYESFHIDYNRL